MTIVQPVELTTPQMSDYIGVPMDLIAGDPSFADSIDMDTVNFGVSEDVLKPRAVDEHGAEVSEFEQDAQRYEQDGRQVVLLRVNQDDLEADLEGLAMKDPKTAEALGGHQFIPMWFALKPGAETRTSPVLRRVQSFGRFPVHELSNRKEYEDDGV